MSSAPRQHSSDDDASHDDLLKSLTDSFNLLADEVQLLSDRKTILEHKLQFAREQYQQLADKYAPFNPDIAHTLAALQAPPDLHVSTPDRATFVPLPSRRPTGSKQQTAEAVRDGRRICQQLAARRGWVHASESGGLSTTGTDNGTINSDMHTSHRATSATTVLEQDFTVAGKLSRLQCPFAARREGVTSPQGIASPTSKETSPYPKGDPICSALYAELDPTAASVADAGAKCPIRFLDHHSPEEVAQYFESHKHQIPRSHEVCVKRYQRNEEDVRKLDAKYGNVVSMIQGLGAKHQPMLPNDDGATPIDAASNERVERWASAVSSDGREPNEPIECTADAIAAREGRFERPMREIRVGESPSRPWGISVPYVETPAIEPVEFARAPSTTPVTVGIREGAIAEGLQPAKLIGKCPFDRSRLPESAPQAIPADHVNMEPDVLSSMPTFLRPAAARHNATIAPVMISTGARQACPQSSTEHNPKSHPAPTFLQHAEVERLTSEQKITGGPSMLFTGPVFIGYPVEDAIRLMQAWRGTENPGT